MTRSTRWTIAVLIVVVALIVALALQLREKPRPGGPPAAEPARPTADLDALRRRADLPPCPADGIEPGRRRCAA